MPPKKAAKKAATGGRARKAQARKAQPRKAQPGTGRARAAYARTERPRAEQARDEPPRAEPPPVSPFQPGFAPECLACPIGLVFFGIRQARPEAMEHLTRAGFELFQAFKAVVDQYEARWEQGRRLERIPIS